MTVRFNARVRTRVDTREKLWEVFVRTVTYDLSSPYCISFSSSIMHGAYLRALAGSYRNYEGVQVLCQN